MDGVLWTIGILPTDPRHRRLDSTPDAHVLLETVAQGAHEGEEPVGAGDLKAGSDRDRDELQELLARVALLGDTDGYDE